MTGFLKGSATAMVTPFAGDSVNCACLDAMIEYQIAGGTDALVVLGTTGEPATLSEKERETVIRRAVETAAGRVKIIVGTGSNSTPRAVELSRMAEELGADGVLAVTPYYNKCTQKGLIAYYESIAAAVNLPVIAYNVPARTGVNLLPATVEQLAEIENFAGIKEASGNLKQVMEILRRVRGKCDVYSGEDALNLPILLVGGSAVISVVANLVPKLVKMLTEAALSGDLNRGAALSDLLLPLDDACFAEVNPIPVKAGMNLIGFAVGDPRPPLTPLDEAFLPALIAAMRACGLEVKA